MKGIKGEFRKVKPLKYVPPENPACKNGCWRPRRNGSAYCERCGRKARRSA